MQRVPLQSAAVVSAGYDPSSRQLELEFARGRVYRYFDVPPGVFEFLLHAPSKGGYVHRMIDGRYDYEEVTTAPEPPDLTDALRRSLSDEGSPER